jgi:hypothetical protein
VTLNPVVAKPNTFLASLSELKDYFAMFEKPLAWMLSALILGMYPAYPGTAVFLGYTEF